MRDFQLFYSTKMKRNISFSAHRWNHTRPWECEKCHLRFPAKGNLVSKCIYFPLQKSSLNPVLAHQNILPFSICSSILLTMTNLSSPPPQAHGRASVPVRLLPRSLHHQREPQATRALARRTEAMGVPSVQGQVQSMPPCVAV